MPYHHGNLREALVDAAMELARKGGPDGVALRAVSREAGVSHNAAYRHFADLEDLLVEVGDRCMAKLGELMEERLRAVRFPPGADPAERACINLMTSGRAYIDFALAEPGWFRTAFTCCKGQYDMEAIEPRYPYRILSDCLDGMVEAGAFPAERRPGAEYPAWSAVHGIATLLLDGPLRDLPDAEREVAINKVVSSAISGL